MTVIQTDTKTALTDNAYFIHHPERIVHTCCYYLTIDCCWRNCYG